MIGLIGGRVGDDVREDIGGTPFDAVVVVVVCVRGPEVDLARCPSEAEAGTAAGLAPVAMVRPGMV